MISGFSMFAGPWLLQDGDLLEGGRLNAYLFLKLPNEGIGWSFAPFAVSADDIPHTRIERPIVRPAGQKDIASSSQEATRTDPHAATIRSRVPP